LGRFLTLLSLIVFLCCAGASIRARWATNSFALSLPAGGRPSTQPARPHFFVFRLRNEGRAVSFAWYVERMLWRPTILLSRISPTSADQALRDPGADLRLPGVRVFDTAGSSFGGKVYLSHWLISSIAAPLPALALLKWLRRVRRYGEGMCQVCGYDLRASEGRCPECGEAIGV
jgi:hypothetical protein